MSLNAVPTAGNGSIMQIRNIWPAPLFPIDCFRFAKPICFCFGITFSFLSNSQRYESIFIFSLKFALFLFLTLLISGLEIREYGRRDPSRLPRGTL
jgi:hypothetical protein